MNTIRIAGRTETGPVRKANEDHILLGRFVKNRGRMSLRIEPDDEFLTAHGFLLAVADGVGGQAGGHLASSLTLSVINREFYVPVNETTSHFEAMERIEISASLANQAMLIRSAQEPRVKSMGSTLTGVCLTMNGYVVYNAGDSRVYRIRDGFMKQLTEDDSITAHAVRAGAMTEEEARESPIRHTLTNALGSPEFTLKVEEGPDFKDGDRLLICSDGLHDMASDEEIESEAASDRDLESTVDNLFDIALDAGGHDNISIILVQAG